MTETINDRIQQRLKELSISEARASVEAGLSIDTIRSMRRRGGAPRGDTLDKLAKILKVTPGWLLNGEEQADWTDPLPVAHVDGKRISKGLAPGFIPEIDIVAGAGGGGYPMPAMVSDGHRSYEGEAIRDQWKMPDRFLEELRVSISNVDIVPVRGDSMTGPHGEGFFDGDRVLINRAERAIRQGGIFAIREDGETIIKQVELLRDGEPSDHPRIICTSINPRYKPFEIILDGQSADIIGRVVCRISRV